MNTSLLVCILLACGLAVIGLVTGHISCYDCSSLAQIECWNPTGSNGLRIDTNCDRCISARLLINDTEVAVVRRCHIGEQPVGCNITKVTKDSTLPMKVCICDTDLCTM